VSQHSSSSLPHQHTTANEKKDLNTRIKALIGAAKCMVFMKGTPDQPRCGFSRRIVELLNKYNTDFSSFNVLADSEVKEGIKKYSDWPTFPQLYIDSDLVGGLDIAVQLAESGELEKMLPKKVPLEERLKELINSFKVMVFMKGSPQEPKCGFSRAVCTVLDETGVEYKTFDITKDDDVRLGLKEFSNWPTYPQLYVNGELVGGLDIVKELKESGELLSTLGVGVN
jgi:Grx4 family monothiol glutaredoxin